VKIFPTLFVLYNPRAHPSRHLGHEGVRVLFTLRKAAEYVLKAALPFFSRSRTPVENDRYPIPPRLYITLVFHFRQPLFLLGACVYAHTPLLRLRILPPLPPPSTTTRSQFPTSPPRSQFGSGPPLSFLPPSSMFFFWTQQKTMMMVRFFNGCGRMGWGGVGIAQIHAPLCPLPSPPPPPNIRAR